ncbi:fungal-specific transcription factor domain-containing protein [Trichoderma chlorosporum]
MPPKSCWNCRDRKIRCDRGLPTCANCRHRNVECRGYGIRLSWPRKGDERRAIELKSTTNQKKHMLATLYQHSLFINMTTWDIDKFYELCVEKSKKVTLERISIPPAIPSIHSLRLHEDESGLLQYFMDTGSRLLILDNVGQLAECILRLAFYDATAASNAILYSLLALSSLNLGRTGPAMVMKIKALSYLQESLRLGNVGHRTAQHLMASMLLYLCETFQISSTTKDWAEYLCGAKQIVASGILAHEVHSDISLLFDWVSYHEVFARFGLVYWKPAAAMRGMRFCTMDPVAPGFYVPRNDFGCDRDVLKYTSVIFTALMPRITEDKSLSALQTQDLYVVEAKLREGLLEPKSVDVTLDELAKDRERTSELYRLAALIYLNRAALGYTGEELRHRNLVNRGLNILCGKLTYIPPWPVFMISCEAREDSQRMTALQIFDRAGEEPRSFNMRLLRELVEASWNQDDLHDEEALDYHMKLRTAIQSAPYVPPFS